MTLKEGETGTLGKDLAIGATVSNLVSQATTLLFTGTASSGVVNGIGDLLGTVGANVSTPLLQNVIGVHRGEMDVERESLQCGNSKLDH
ncbi:MAG: hypothetical protein ACRYGA_02540 [Janthinobacterium lividum]